MQQASAAPSGTDTRAATLRVLFYLGYYLLNVVFAKDWLAVWATAPLMILILYDVVHIRGRHVFVDDMVTFIFYLYFVVDPVQHINHGHLNPSGPVGAIVYGNGDIVTASLIALLFYLIYMVLRRYLMRFRRPVDRVLLPGGTMPLLVAIAFVSFAGYVVLFGGLENLFAARYDQNAEDVSALKSVPQALQIVSTILLATFVRFRVDRSLFLFGAAFALLAIALNPFNAARFVLIAAYVPIGFILLRGRIGAGAFYGAAMVGIVVVMPLLSLTTRFGSLDAAYHRGAATGTSSVLDLPFLDVFDLLVECVRYTKIHGYTWGGKLLVDALFFVPRAIWTGKPTLNALDIGQNLFATRQAGTANLSMFVGGDGYRDFGLAGVALSAVLATALLHLLLYRRPRVVNGSPVLQYMFLAAVPILMRGPIAAIMPILLMQWVWFAVLTRVLGRTVHPNVGAMARRSLALPVRQPAPGSVQPG